VSRATLAVNRVVTFLVGLILVASGAAAILWWRGTVPSWPDRLDLGTVIQTGRQPWWPWAAGLLGIALVLLGVRWLAAHLPNPAVSQLRLPGSNPQGQLHVSTGPVAAQAADLLAQTAGVRTARGTITRDRGELFARLNATIEPEADLRAVAAAADCVSAELRSVLQREDLRCQVRLRVAARGRSLPRVT